MRDELSIGMKEKAKVPEQAYHSRMLDYGMPTVVRAGRHTGRKASTSSSCGGWVKLMASP